MSKTNISALAENLGYVFLDAALLDQAMHHSSYVNEQRNSDLQDNERLEFLGDAVLDLVITHILMMQFPDAREGDLSRMRATIVNETQLAEVAQNLGLGDYLLLGRGETQCHGKEKNSILADAMEAVIAAVYLDGGLPAAFGVVERHFMDLIPPAVEEAAPTDYKSRLQELVQQRFKSIPKYRVVGEAGPDHDKTFQVRLTIGKRLTAHGSGKSKKNAEQAAASKALEQLGAEDDML